MKDRLLKQVLAFIGLSLLSVSPTSFGLANDNDQVKIKEPKHSISVEISNIRLIKGALHYQILSCRQEEPITGNIIANKQTEQNSMPLDKLAILAQSKVAIKSSTLTISNLALTHGLYAIRIFQDLNNNQKLDVSANSIPIEPVGFSNNPSLAFGEPNTAKICFDLNHDLILKIKLKNKKKRKRLKRQ